MEEKSTIDIKKDTDKVLGILDTYHDFCKSERKTASSSAEDKRIDVMRAYLPKVLHSKFTNFAKSDSITENIEKLTADKVGSISKIEHETVELFEEDFDDQIEAHIDTKEVISFKDIIKAYKEQAGGFDENTNPLWKRFRENEGNRVLELQKDGIEIENAEIAKILADFILNYFFFTRNQENIHLTFDASDGTVGDIFRNSEDVTNIIFPQTIADSATTNLNVLQGRSTYIFPSITNKVPFKSNVFSETDYEIYFENDSKSPFSNENPYGFSIVIQNKAKERERVVLPFSSTQTEGPSVNYIIDILNSLEQSKTDKIQLSNIKKKSTILSLGLALDKYPPMKEALHKGIRAGKNGILPDLKRGGDHEAVNAAKYAQTNLFPFTFFVTIDMLCALKARKEKLNTIWQTSQRLVLYRTPVRKPDEALKYTLLSKAQEGLDIIARINYLNGKSFATELGNQIVECERGFQAMVDLHTKPKEPTYRKQCELMLNALLRIRMLDMKKYIESIMGTQFNALTAAETTQLTKLTTNLSIFQGEKETLLVNIQIQEDGESRVASLKKKPTGSSKFLTMTTSDVVNAVDTLKGYYTQIIKTLEEKINIDIRKALDGKPFLEVSKPLTKEGLFVRTDHSVFNYSSEPFYQLYELMLIVQELYETNKIRATRDYPNKIRKILQKGNSELDYFKVADEVVSQFQSGDIRTKMSSIVLFAEKALSAATEAAEGAVDREGFMRSFLTGSEDGSIKGVVETVLEYYTVLNTGTPKKGKKAAIPGELPYALDVYKVAVGGQRGGAGPVIQYYELSDLLFSISTKAAAYLESAFSNRYTFSTLFVQAYHLEFVFSYVQRYAEQTKYNYPYCINLFQNLYRAIKLFLGTDEYKILPAKNRTTSNGIWSTINILTREGRAFDSYTHENTTEAQREVMIASLKTTIENIILWVQQMDNAKDEDDVPYFVYPPIDEIFSYLQEEEFEVDLYDMENSEIAEAPPIIENEGENNESEGENNESEGENNESEGENNNDNENEDETDDKKINAAIKLLDELQEEWEYGLQQIRENPTYEFSKPEGRRVATEDLLSAILSLRTPVQEETNEENSENNNENYVPTNAESSYLLDSNKLPTEASEADITVFTDFKTIIKAHSETIVELFQLYLLTLLENIQNPYKYSFFLIPGYTNYYFDSAAEWNDRLQAHLSALITLIGANWTTAKKLELASVLRGGKYPKKTRKAKSKSVRKTRKHK